MICDFIHTCPFPIECADDNIKLSADPTLLSKSGEWVNVSWSGVQFPTKDDWLGVWVLPNSTVSIDARKKAPIKFQVGPLYCRLAVLMSRATIGLCTVVL